MQRGLIDIVITDGYLKEFDYKIRRTAADRNIPLVLNGRLGLALVNAFDTKQSIEELSNYY